MRPLHASLYDIDLGSQSAEEVVLELTDLSQDWIKKKYLRETPRWGHADISFPSDGSSSTPLQGHELTAILKQVPSGTLSSILWIHPDGQDDNASWVIRLSIAAMDGRAQFHCLVGIESRIQLLRPLHRPVGRPRLITDVLNQYSVRIGEWALRKTPRQLQKEGIPAFVENVLCSPKRTIPVVLISPDAWTGRPSVDPDEIQRDLAGFAEIAVLTDKFAAFALTDEVGKGLACYDGAVRVYWPGFELDAERAVHPLLFASTLKRMREQGERWSLKFRSHLSAASIHAFAQSEVASKVRRVLAERDNQRAREALERLRKADEEDQDLYEELEQALTRAEKAEEQIKKLEAQVEQLSFAANWSSQSEGTEGDQQPTASDGRSFASVGEAVDAARADFKGKLVFLNTAIESAQNSPFSRPQQVYDMLAAMAKVTERWQAGEGSLGESWERAVEEHGYEFKVKISETSRNQWGDQYTFRYRGHQILFEQHITLGAKSAEKCISAHFHRDTEKLLLVVGWCGRHLRNTKT